MVTTALSTTCALVRSVAVHSMNTLRVASVILECSPLMIGGSEHTTRLASKMTGYTGLQRQRRRGPNDTHIIIYAHSGGGGYAAAST